MKKLFLTMAAISVLSFSSLHGQSLGYQDLGLLFSSSSNSGTARFEAMGGAFGALGGDVSVMNINPAGLSVFSTSMISGTYKSRETSIDANYYGTNSVTNENYYDISNAGAALVFDSPYKSDWTKYAVGFNYRIKNDFSNRFFITGNSNIPTFREFPLDQNDPPIQYDFSDEQNFNNNFTGDIREFTVALSAVHKNRLYIGGSLNFTTLNFSQTSVLTEFNNDGNGNTLTANLFQDLVYFGDGLSANVGFIYKLTRNLRIGASYQTPTWYSQIYEDTNLRFNDGFIGEAEITTNTSNEVYNNTPIRTGLRQNLDFELRTPSKITASAALVLGRLGLISVDYSTKNYQDISLSGVDFNNENLFFQNELKNAYSLNVGSEIRLGLLSLRGGYVYEQSPFRDATEEDDFEGYSYGLGYNFGNFKIDLAYRDSSRRSVYNFYSQFDNIDAANLNTNNKVFTATLSLAL